VDTHQLKVSKVAILHQADQTAAAVAVVHLLLVLMLVAALVLAVLVVRELRHRIQVHQLLMQAVAVAVVIQ
jgi:hypothetical protein